MNVVAVAILAFAFGLIGGLFVNILLDLLDAHDIDR